VCILVPVDVESPQLGLIDLSHRFAVGYEEPVLLTWMHPQRPRLDALAALYRLGAPLRDAGIPVHIRAWSGDPISKVCALTQDARCRCVLLGASQEGWPGAMTRRVFREAGVPVMALRRGRVGRRGWRARVHPASRHRGSARAAAGLLGERPDGELTVLGLADLSPEIARSLAGDPVLLV